MAESRTVESFSAFGTLLFGVYLTDKLREVFDHLFAVKDERKDKLESGDDDSDGEG